MNRSEKAAWRRCIVKKGKAWFGRDAHVAQAGWMVDIRPEIGAGGPDKRGVPPSSAMRARAELPPPQSPGCAVLGSSL